jgi:putative transposase
MKAYKFRIYPSWIQQKKIQETFDICKNVYNKLLDLSIKKYKNEKKGLSKYQMNKINTGKHREVYSQVLQNVSDRVSKSYQNFFRRVKDKNCKEKGFPRFKSSIKSITYPQHDTSKTGFFIDNKKLFVSKIGKMPIILHREINGEIKTLTIKKNESNQYFAVFCCDEYSSKKVKTEGSVGIDVGLKTYATLSDGNAIENPRFMKKSEKKLIRLHRELSRKKGGSNNRQKAKLRLVRQYQRIENQRKDFLHKITTKLAKNYKICKVEDLKIYNMMRNHHLAKSIADASWGTFVNMLSYKVVANGGRLIKVEPRYTSQTCSNCGKRIKMPLNKRIFDCECGLKINRDLNASINIHGREGHSQTYTPDGDCVRPLKAVVDEAGTILRGNTIGSS